MTKKLLKEETVKRLQEMAGIDVGTQKLRRDLRNPEAMPEDPQKQTYRATREKEKSLSQRVKAGIEQIGKEMSEKHKIKNSTYDRTLHNLKVSYEAAIFTAKQSGKTDEDLKITKNMIAKDIISVYNDSIGKPTDDKAQRQALASLVKMLDERFK
jgi:hypothetical protein